MKRIAVLLVLSLAVASLAVAGTTGRLTGNVKDDQGAALPGATVTVSSPTEIGGVPEMITDPRFGTIVPPGDKPALASALTRALTAQWDRDAISRQGLSRSWEQVALEVYEQLSAAALENRR